MDVAGLGADVEVAHHAEGISLALLLLQVPPQAGQPLKLVGVLFALERAAVGHVEIQHPDAVDQGADHPFLLAETGGFLLGGQHGLKADLHVLEG